MGKVLKVIVVMRSLFIDRTIVKGYNENVYTEDGKVSILESWAGVLLCLRMEFRVSDIKTSKSALKQSTNRLVSVKMNEPLTRTLSFSLLASSSPMPSLEFLIDHLRPQLPH